MTGEKAVLFLYSVLQEKGLESSLTNLQEVIFRHSWEGKTYDAIAQDLGYDSDYVRQIGSQVWKLLSQALAEKVTKVNFKSVLKRYNASIPLATPSSPISNTKQDWKEAIDVLIFYGRTEELDSLERSILHEKTRLVTILGMGGMGKTSLAVKVAKKIQHEFDFLIWKNLHNAPPLANVLSNIISFISEQKETELPPTTTGKISLLLQYLSESRCLIIFDNLESILSSGEGTVNERSGDYLEGYEDYGDLFREVVREHSSSCFILTSREKTKKLDFLERENASIQILELSGLKQEAGQALFKTRGDFVGSAEEWQTIVRHYGGNPLALKMVSIAIQEVFASNLSQFVEYLHQEILIFDDIKDLLERQFRRLSEAEEIIMYWLAIEREPVSFLDLTAKIVHLEDQAELIEILRSLTRRFLVEKSATGFTQQPVVMDYCIQRFLNKIYGELATQKISYLMTHPLMQASAKSYIQESQFRVIVKPIVTHLSTKYRSPQEQLNEILLKLQKNFAFQPGYGAGNVLNLLIQLEVDLKGSDFSNLAVWEADLQKVKLHQVNFSRSDLSKSSFIEAFGEILSLDFSVDGKLLATSDTQGKIVVRQVKDGQVIQSFQHIDWLWSVAFSPNGKTLVTGGINQTLRLWDIATGSCIQTFSGDEHTHYIYSVSFSPNGQIVASGSGDFTLKLWSVKTGRCLKTLKSHSHRVYTVAFSPKGDTLISGSADKTIKLWDVKTGKCLRTFVGSPDDIWSVAFSPNGKTLASAGYDAKIRLWDLVTGECLQVFSGHISRIFSVAFSADGQYLASGGDDHLVKVWDLYAGKCVHTLRGHTNRIFSVAFHSQNPHLLATGGSDRQLLLWDIKTGQRLQTLQGYGNGVWSVASHSQSSLVASGSEDGVVRIWDLETEDCIQTLEGHRMLIWTVAFSPQGDRVATSSYDCTVKVWNLTTGECLYTFPINCLPSRPVAFNSSGEILATSGNSQGDHYAIQLWDLQSGNLQQSLLKHLDVVSSLAFASHRPLLVSGSYDQTVKVWNPLKGECLLSLEGHSNIVWSVGFHPQKAVVASGSEDGTVKLWDINTGECLETFSGHSSGVLGIQFSPQGDLLASSSRDRTIKLWNIKTGECVQTLSGHTDQVWSGDFTPNGLNVISGSLDWTIKLWDVKTGQCLKTLRPPRPYEGVNIRGIEGLTESAIATLKILGAVETVISDQ